MAYRQARTPSKSGNKKQREQQVLLGLIDLYLKTGKPIGSNTLKEHGFDHLSSATIRNYFAYLEKDDFLKQQHTSSGRVPTEKAFRLFAETNYAFEDVGSKDDLFLSTLLLKETKEIAQFLQSATEALSELTGCAAFISAPRFDQDMIADMRLVPLDEHRLMCIFISEFSLTHTEVLYTPRKFSSFSIKRMEEYCKFRLTGKNEPKLSDDEAQFAKHAFNELMLRHFANQANFSTDDLYRAGFSKLLSHIEFQEMASLGESLSLFENAQLLGMILRDSEKSSDIYYVIGSEIRKYLKTSAECSIVTIPYKIQQNVVGSIGLLTPLAIDYRKIFAIMRKYSSYMSESLTKSMEAFSISYRRPHTQYLDMQQSNKPLALLASKNNQ
ncbi:MAG: Heat-inducible transcription repressor HrcA [Chlamydiia bacterium]|nr:Heat-inducible transcription repressor HrcA [Chlamydiia bacterium]